jgi:hypothetical protein
LEEDKRFSSVDTTLYDAVGPERVVEWGEKGIP